MTNWAFESAADMALAVREKQVSALELLDYFLARSDRFNPSLNAIVVDDRERAHGRASEADAALAKGVVWGPLHGVPMTVKESYDIAGLASTHGMPELADNIAQTDALSISRLKAAGAVIFGKTNVPLRLADFQSYNEIYGTTNNPYDVGRTPGGSSGGSAAALAAGITGLDTGSDIGGSIRNPAHFCGVFGHKPTWGLLPTRGHAPPGVLTPTDISVIGPLARTTADLELAMNVMAGPDELAARGIRYDLTRLAKPINQWKIALWDTDDFAPVSQEVRRRVQAAGQLFADAGAVVDAQARPDFTAEESHDVFQRLLQPAMSGRLPDAAFAALVERADGLNADDHGWGAKTVRAQTARHRDWLAANEARTRLRWAWHRFFAQWDVVLMPIMAVEAFEHDHRPFHERRVSVDGQDRPYFEQGFWAGLTGVSLLPSTTVPTGLSEQGLPIGIQIAGPEYGDLITLQASQFLEDAGMGFVPPSGYND
ncbi:MAG: amidase [Gammaproteobacteria bacterium]|jgi:amidase